MTLHIGLVLFVALQMTTSGAQCKVQAAWEENTQLFHKEKIIAFQVDKVQPARYGAKFRQTFLWYK